MVNSNGEMKKFLIERIDTLNEDNFLKTVKSNDLGSSNIRAMGNVALNCDCYSEFRLFMEYKKAKLDGWRITKSNGKALADVVIADLDSIYEKCHQDDSETLKWISQYFGYFYWKKASLEEVKDNKNNNKNNTKKKYDNGGNK